MTLSVTEEFARSIAFVKKLNQPIYKECDGSVEITFNSDLSVGALRTKIAVEKSKWGGTGKVVRCPSSTTPSPMHTMAPSSSSCVPVVLSPPLSAPPPRVGQDAATTTIAVSSRLLAVKEECSLLSPGDKHALLVWLALEIEKWPSQSTPAIDAMLGEKREMAVGFTSLLASDWGVIEAPFDPGMPCECNCGGGSELMPSVLPVVVPPV